MDSTLLHTKGISNLYENKQKKSLMSMSLLNVELLLVRLNLMKFLFNVLFLLFELSAYILLKDHGDWGRMQMEQTP